MQTKTQLLIDSDNPYNIGSIDRALRFFIGGILVGSVFYLDPSLTITLFSIEFALIKVLPLIGIYPAITAWLGWDPIYELFNTTSETRFKSDVCDDLWKQAKAVTRF